MIILNPGKSKKLTVALSSYDTASGTNKNEGIYKEIEESKVPASTKVELLKLDGHCPQFGKYFRSNTYGVTNGKYFEKIGDFPTFEAICQEDLIKMNGFLDIKTLFATLEKVNENQKFTIFFNKIYDNSCGNNGTYRVEIGRYLEECEIKQTSKEITDCKHNFKNMYEFKIFLAFDRVDENEKNQIIEKYVSTIDTCIDLKQLKEIVHAYKLTARKSSYSYRKISDPISEVTEIEVAPNTKNTTPISTNEVSISDIMTLSEATTKWGLADGVLRKLISTGVVTENIDYRKSGRMYLITKAAMIRIYGNSK